MCAFLKIKKNATRGAYFFPQVISIKDNDIEIDIYGCPFSFFKSVGTPCSRPWKKYFRTDHFYRLQYTRQEAGFSLEEQKENRRTDIFKLNLEMILV